MAATAVTKERGKETLSLDERIRRRAYELKMMTHPALLYVERGNQSGSELDDSLQAEEETERGEEQRRRSKS
jgi:hypothetical protein